MLMGMLRRDFPDARTFLREEEGLYAIDSIEHEHEQEQE